MKSSIPIPETVLSNHPRIKIDQGIMGGYPCIKGTRIPTYVILDMIEGGCSFEEILNQYPTLSKEDITAAIHFASELATKATCAHSAR